MHKKLILYGAGSMGQLWIKKLGKENVYGVIDSNKEKTGTIFCGFEIKSIEYILKCKNDIVIFPTVYSSEHRLQIIEMLKKEGMENCVVFTPYYDKAVLEEDSFCDINVEFEGANYIGSNVHITDSKLGYGTYISANTSIDKCVIGRYTSIGPNLKIICGQHPSHNFVSTHPVFYSTENMVLKKIGINYIDEQLFEEFRYVEKDIRVKIGNDVWVGQDVSIMEGVNIADGTIVAAGAVVSKDTKPYSIIGGIPAKVISHRFKEDDIDFLLKLKWWEKSEKWIKKNAHLFKNINILKREVEVDSV